MSVSRSCSPQPPQPSHILNYAYTYGDAGKAGGVQTGRGVSIARRRETAQAADGANIGAYSKHAVAYAFTGEGKTTGVYGCRIEICRCLC